MKQLTENELLWSKFVKAVRANIRLKYSLMADEELNRLLPELEKKFAAAEKLGQAKDLAVEEASKILLELGDGE